MVGVIKLSGSLILAFGVFVITAILVTGKMGHAEEGAGLLSSLKNLFTGIEKNREVFEQVFSQSMSVKDEKHLVISHSHGNITVRGWDKSEVKLDGIKIVSARDKETARMYAEQMKVEITSEDGRMIVRTIRPKHEEAWDIRSITINYELCAPNELNVTLENAHGNVLVENFAERLDLNCRHGNLQIAQIGGDALIEHEHGNIGVSHLGGDASVYKEHGDVKIKSVDGELKMSHEHGNADLTMIRAGAYLTKRHGNLSAVDVAGMLKLDHEHGKTLLEMIKGDVEVNKQHGSIDIKTVNGNVSIYSEHGTLRIAGVEGDVRLRGSHGNAYIEDVSGFADVSRSHSKSSFNNVEKAVPR